jgi:hypothetical protein
MKAYSRTIALFALILVLFGVTSPSKLASLAHRGGGNGIPGGSLVNPLDDGSIGWETLQIDDGTAEPQNDGKTSPLGSRSLGSGCINLS